MLQNDSEIRLLTDQKCWTSHTQREFNEASVVTSENRNHETKGRWTSEIRQVNELSYRTI